MNDLFDRDTWVHCKGAVDGSTCLLYASKVEVLWLLARQSSQRNFPVGRLLTKWR
jgi:hypothetical protein